MKTTDFIIRVAICFLLSLIPWKDLENRIYAARMELRPRTAPSIVLVTVPAPYEPGQIEKLTHQKPATVVELPAMAAAPELVTEIDGTVSKAVAVTEKGMQSTAFRAYLAKGLDPERIRRPQEPHLINFSGPAGTVPICHLGRGACPSLEGKTVIVVREADLGEMLRTPLGEMSRAETVANDVHTVANRRTIYQAGWVERGLLILAMILLGAFYIIYYPVLISALAVTGTGVAVVVVFFQLIFQLFDIYIPSVNIGGSLLVTYLTFTGYRMAVQENLQWRSLKQSQYLKEVDQMKSNFLSLVSHDLKTPLAKIQAMTERLKRELPQGKEMIDSIENSNNELKHYITSILNLSKIESQKVILNIKSNDINQLIQQALKRLRPLAAQKSLTFEERLDPLFSVECDEDLMRQVLTNLIDNAVKYSPPGAKIIISSREEDGFIRVEVQDFGPGIPKDQLPLMFRKFSRFLRPIQEQVKGTGLGLYLSKYFIELHGGTIRVHSVEGQGTTFTFTLPLHGVESETILG